MAQASFPGWRAIAPQPSGDSFLSATIRGIRRLGMREIVSRCGCAARYVRLTCRQVSETAAKSLRQEAAVTACSGGGHSVRAAFWASQSALVAHATLVSNRWRWAIIRCKARRISKEPLGWLYGCPAVGRDDLRHFLAFPRLALVAVQCGNLHAATMALPPLLSDGPLSSVWTCVAYKVHIAARHTGQDMSLADLVWTTRAILRSVAALLVPGRLSSALRGGRWPPR